MPKRTKKWMATNDQLIEMRIKILKFFNGNVDKAILWFETANPGLGNISPNDMIKIGREEKLNKFIDNCLEGNFP